MNIVHLTCNRTVNPMGLDTSDIFFSYHILDEKKVFLRNNIAS